MVDGNPIIEGHICSENMFHSKYRIILLIYLSKIKIKFNLIREEICINSKEIMPKTQWQK